MPRLAEARKTGTRRSVPAGRRAWPRAVVVAVIALLTACSASTASRAATAAASASRTTPTGAPGARTVPMTVVKQGPATLELVPVSINGHGPYTFVLDTGSSISSVSKQLATTLKLPRTGTIARVSGVVTSTNVPLVLIRGWKVGQVTLAPEKVAMLSLSKMIGPVAGLLGSDELSRFGAVTLNFRTNQVRITPP